MAQPVALMPKKVIDNDETDACKIAFILDRLSKEILSGERTPTQMALILVEPCECGGSNFHREVFGTVVDVLALTSVFQQLTVRDAIDG